MKIIEPSFSLSISTQEEGINLLRFIEKQARISHRSEDAQTENSWERFIRSVVLEHGDYSVIEHAGVTVTIRTDRGITHELVRHRLFSFTMESTRFVRYGKKHDLEFITPWEFLPDLKKIYLWQTAMKDAEAAYFNLLERGARPQEARSVLPNSTASTIAMSGNLRNWRWFFLARTTKEAHPDMKRVTIPMLAEFKEKIPVLFEDIEADARQIENARKAH